MGKHFDLSRPSTYKANEASTQVPISNEKKNKCTTLYMRADLHAELKILAVKNNLKLTDLINTALEDFLYNNKYAMPIQNDDLAISPELMARIEKSRKQIAEGKCYICRNKEELNSFLDSL